ncbi:MAG: pentapeptide repeat-containing protein, partial [Ktedonobacterales bacterium]
MSDESGQSEQEQPYERASIMGDKWGDAISEERKQELLRALRAWWDRDDHSKQQPPFKGQQLTGAEVFWLAVYAGAKRLEISESEAEHLTRYPVKSFKEMFARIFSKQPYDLDLSLLCLQGADLSDAQLQGADLTKVQLQGANLSNAKLQRANLSYAHLQGTFFFQAQLQGAHLIQAQLQGASLSSVQLEGALLSEAQLEGANLYGAQLEGAALDGANLTGADIRSASLSKKTRLDNTLLTDVRLDGVMFDNANLTVIDWERVTLLKDEIVAHQTTYAVQIEEYADGTEVKTLEKKPLQVQREDYKSAVRANRILAVALRNQGLNEEADRFAYRAQLLQQEVLRRQRKFGGYVFSRLLDGLAGYGYKPVRGLIAYLLVILGFAVAYGLATHGVLTFGLPRSSIEPLQWYEALVLSISSFHGRGFFQPVQSLG